MIDLSDEQKAPLLHPGNCLITACPGSGKTRTLLARVQKGMLDIGSPFERIAALTFSNIAADEINSRLNTYIHYDKNILWSGTIHSFALEWILRPYASYVPKLSDGFTLIDDHAARELITELKNKHEMKFYDPVITQYGRHREDLNNCDKASRVLQDYRKYLLYNKLIDYDQILYFSYRLLNERKEIAATLGAIFRLICLDEFQDVQDLQYGILSTIYKASENKPCLFLVGDEDQAIYENLGGASKSLREVKAEFGGIEMVPFRLTRNYRSTQKLVDYFSYFRNVSGVESKVDEGSDISFSRHSIDKNDLAIEISKIIKKQIENGVPNDQICIVAPHHSNVRSMTNRLIKLLPHLDFNAPVLSPFYGQRDNIWFNIAKLLLTDPSGRMFVSRMKLAKDTLNQFRGIESPVSKVGNLSTRQFLRLINSFRSSQKAGVAYLKEGFDYILNKLGIKLIDSIYLATSYEGFFEKSRYNLEKYEDEFEDNVAVFRRFFAGSKGIVINTCHGVKGEEYHTVIAFGLLKGYIPNWNDIIGCSEDHQYQRESKLLYVVASRAKRSLHLISESGRQTKNGNALEVSPLLSNRNYPYDTWVS